MAPFAAEMEAKKGALANTLIKPAVIRATIQPAADSSVAESIHGEVAAHPSGSVVTDFKHMLATGKVHMRAGNLPAESTEKLLYWFLDHLRHPYPTIEEKSKLAAGAGKCRAPHMPGHLQIRVPWMPA